MYCYQLSPNVYLEIFKQDAVLLIADRDVMVTVNLAAAKLYECARESFGYGDFNRFDCVHFLLESYDMSDQEAEDQMRSILGFGLKQRLVLKKAAA
jgi:hypothetical protein